MVGRAGLGSGASVLFLSILAFRSLASLLAVSHGSYLGYLYVFSHQKSPGGQ